MIIPVLLLVHKWTTEHKTEMALLVLIVQHWLDLANVAVIYLDDVEFFCVQVLDYDFWTVILGYVDCYELFETVKF